jgi:hypothetical protein
MTGIETLGSDFDAVEHPSNTETIGAGPPIRSPRHIEQPERIASPFRELSEEPLGLRSLFKLEVYCDVVPIPQLMTLRCEHVRRHEYVPAENRKLNVHHHVLLPFGKRRHVWIRRHIAHT